MVYPCTYGLDFNLTYSLGLLFIYFLQNVQCWHFTLIWTTCTWLQSGQTLVLCLAIFQDITIYTMNIGMIFFKKSINSLFFVGKRRENKWAEKDWLFCCYRATLHTRDGRNRSRSLTFNFARLFHSSLFNQ